MNICGISIKGKDAIIVVINNDGEIYELIDTGITKLSLDNDTDQDELKTFFSLFQSFIRENKIDIVGIKKRNHSGNFAGGAISFKIEAIIQLLDVSVHLYAPITISRTSSNIKFKKLKYNYQKDAYSTAYTTMVKNA